MKKPLAIREILAWVLFIVVTCVAVIDRSQNVDLQEDKIRAKEKIKFYEKDAKAYHALADSFKLKSKIDSALIEYQKNNPKIVEKKYVEVLNGVLTLPVDDKISYLSGWVSKKDSNR